MAQGSTPPATGVPPAQIAVARATQDMPDEEVGQQIHLVYAVPRGGIDRALDTSDRLRNSAAAINHWLGQQTGGSLRMKYDTYQGRLDITFVQLPRSDEEYDLHGVNKLVAIESDMRLMGQMQPGKAYAVYYEGGNSRTCADAGSALDGHQTAVIYLRGLEGVRGVNPCSNNVWGTGPTAQPQYLDFGLLHEILHIAGIGHVSDSPYDLMYGGSARWNEPDKIVLDYNKDHYAFDRSEGGRARGQPNIYNSPYMERIIR